jgi:hypothetical protein
MPTGKEFGHRTQRLAPARNSRTDRSDRKVDQRCRFLVSQTFQSDEQNYRPLLLGQFGESPLQITKLEPGDLIGRKRRGRMTFLPFLPFRAGALARVAASKADMLMVQDRE